MEQKFGLPVSKPRHIAFVRARPGLYASGVQLEIKRPSGVQNRPF